MSKFYPDLSSPCLYPIEFNYSICGVMWRLWWHVCAPASRTGSSSPRWTLLCCSVPSLSWPAGRTSRRRCCWAMSYRETTSSSLGDFILPWRPRPDSVTRKYLFTSFECTEKNIFPLRIFLQFKKWKILNGKLLRKSFPPPIWTRIDFFQSFNWSKVCVYVSEICDKF